MKKHRELIFAKYGGRCAYCGIELQKGWHIDHIEPAYHNWSDDDIKKHIKKPRGLNEVENYNPACPRCNRWKGTWSIEEFRHEIFMQTERLKRDSASYRLLLDFKRIDEEYIPVEFFFETFEKDRIKIKE